jgi:hypothetical protein
MEIYVMYHIYICMCTYIHVYIYFLHGKFQVQHYPTLGNLHKKDRLKGVSNIYIHMYIYIYIYIHVYYV